MKIIFIRHGESAANAKLEVGGPDSPLSEKGIEQARTTGLKLKGQHVTQIVCSPFPRARQTAEIIAGVIGVPASGIIVVNELHERRMGVLEEKPKIHSSEFFIQNDDNHGFETHSQVISRVQDALAKIEDIAKKTDGTTLVVGHAASGYFLQQVARGKTKIEDFDEFKQLPNADYIVLERR